MSVYIVSTSSNTLLHINWQTGNYGSGRFPTIYIRSKY